MRRREHLTFTNRLLLLAALIVISTTLLLVATSAAGVYQMAVRQESARQAAYADVLVARVGGRIRAIHADLRASVGDTGYAGSDERAIQSALSSTAFASGEYLEGVALIRETTATPLAWPPEALDQRSLEALRSLDASSAIGPVLWVEPAADTPGVLWVVTTLVAEDGRARVLGGRVRTGFVQTELDGITGLPGSPDAVLFDRGGQPIMGSMDLAGLAGADVEFSPEEDGSGGRVSVETTRPAVGAFADFDEIRGLGWRVAVLEPRSQAWRDTWMALRPGLLGWVTALAVALVGALSVVTRTIRPLRQLEKRVRAIGAGEQVEPIEPVDEHDEIGRLLDAFNSVLRRLNRLTDATDLLARTSDRAELLSGLTSSIAHLFDPADVDLFLNAEDGIVRLEVAHGSLESSEGTRLEVSGSGLLARAFAAGAPATAVGEESDRLFALHGMAPAVGVATPLWAGPEMIGVVAIVRTGERVFSESERETLRAFVAQAAVALQNSRLFEEERGSRREAEALREIAERVAAPTGVRETLDYVARAQAELLGFDRSVVVMLDDPTSYGLPATREADVGSAWVDAWTALQARAESSESVFVDERDPAAAVSWALTQAGVRAALLTPAVRLGRPVALLVATSSGSRTAPGTKRLALAGTIGRQAALALENAFLLQEAKNRADNLETIFRISHAVGSSLQTRVVLNRVLDVVQKILSADAVMLMTYDSQKRIITVPMARGILHRDMLEVSFRPGEDVPGRVFETREPERYDRISSTDTRLLNAAAGQGLESLLAVPLLARGRSIGVLVVFARAVGAFSSDELDLLRTFAAQAALAIDTAEMFSREHHVATVLQESILPTGLPHIDGLDASSVYLPAGTDADIGGDYYDLFVDSDGRVVISIGDVCGKGVVAATKTSMIKYSVRGMTAAGLGPARIMSELNGMLMESGDATSIVTLWIASLDLETGLLRYANGGHPPGLLAQPDGSRIDRLATTGALLGAVADIAWEEREIRMQPGATLLLYTDGVTEARSQARFFGEGRVRRALRAGGGAAAVSQRLLAMVQRFSAGELRDDAAILVVAYVPGGSGASLGADAAVVSAP